MTCVAAPTANINIMILNVIIKVGALLIIIIHSGLISPNILELEAKISPVNKLNEKHHLKNPNCH